MVEISDSLRSLFSANLEEQDGSFVVEIPSNEFEHETLTIGETYRVAIFESLSSTESTTEGSQHNHSRHSGSHASSGPPVDEGEIRDVTIETVGDQGDGIAKVERGYVVIVPGAQPGDEPTVEIEQVQENVAFASVVNSDPRAL